MQTVSKFQSSAEMVVDIVFSSYLKSRFQISNAPLSARSSTEDYCWSYQVHGQVRIVQIIIIT